MVPLKPGGRFRGKRDGYAVIECVIVYDNASLRVSLSIPNERENKLIDNSVCMEESHGNLIYDSVDLSSGAKMHVSLACFVGFSFATLVVTLLVPWLVVSRKIINIIRSTTDFYDEATYFYVRNYATI